MDSDEKAHTFRKRRLSLALRHDNNHSPPSPSLAATAAAPASSDDSPTTAQLRPTNKRRLTLQLLEDRSNDYHSNHHHQHPYAPLAAPQQQQRPRRHSEATTVASDDRSYPSKTVHASELLTPGPPPSPAVQPSNILYTHKPRPATAATDATDHLALPLLPPPRWKKRHTIRKQDSHKLPFPLQIVGTYSCHGMEPIYDNDPDDLYYNDDHHLDGPGWDDDGIDDVPTMVPNVGGTILLDHHPLSSSTEERTTRDPTTVDHVPSPEHETAMTKTPVLPGGGDTTNDSHNTEPPAPPPPPPQQQPHDVASTTTRLLDPSQLHTVAKINQDRGGIVFPYGNCPKTALFAVYDGHGQGGELISQFALHEIQRRLEQHESFTTDLQKAMRETFVMVDEALKEEPLIEPLYAGTTACVALIQEHTITLANAGDSRAVLARRRRQQQQQHMGVEGGSSSSSEPPPPKWDSIELTEDQNPDHPMELARIVKAGGYVTASPSPGLSARLWLDETCTQIGLAMARSIGDHAVSPIGVIAEPVVTTYELDDSDDFLILASDGVWEFLESTEAVQIVGGNLHRGATKACQALIEAAAAKWHEEEGEYRDDITAIVVRLQELWKGNDGAKKTES